MRYANLDATSGGLAGVISPTAYPDRLPSLVDAPAGPAWTNLHTVILDEILPHPRGCTHEIAFRPGTDRRPERGCGRVGVEAPQSLRPDLHA